MGAPIRPWSNYNSVHSLPPKSSPRPCKTSLLQPLCDTDDPTQMLVSPLHSISLSVPPPLCSLIILPLPRLDDGDERKRPSLCENNQGREAQEGKEEEEEEPLQFCMPERSPLILSFPSASPPPRNRVAISPTGLDSPSPLLNSETVRRRSREWS